MDSQIIIGRGTASGTDNYVVTLSVAVDELHNGNVIYITFTNGNNGAADINPNGIGVLDLTDQYGDPLQGGEITDGCKLQLEYNLANDNLRIISCASTGNIARVLSVTKTDIQTISNDVAVSWADITDLTITLTPSKASDKFLIQGNVSGNATSNSILFIRILRIVDPSGAATETAVGVGDAAGNRSLVTTSGWNDGIKLLTNLPYCFMDSPATADEVLYKVQAATSDGVTDAGINRTKADTNSTVYTRSISSLTIFQIN